MPAPNRLFFTTSWDDGHPMDNRLAELLAKYDIQGTFYIPAFNIEGRCTLTDIEIMALASSFEVGGHTYSHIYLDKLSPSKALQEILDGKKYIEQILGKSISGFCYPGGKYNHAIKEYVKNAGFKYARTITNFSLGSNQDPFRLSTTLQFHNHNRAVYSINYLKNMCRQDMYFPIFLNCLRNSSLLDRLYTCFELALASGGIFHLWGHSWEIEEHQNWKILEDFFIKIDSILDKDSRITNYQTAQLLTKNTIL